jgi:hypothetical protein
VTYEAVFTSEASASCVAKIGDTCYNTLATAVEAADGKTVVLQSDTNIPAVANTDLVINGDVTIDLNGKTLTMSDPKVSRIQVNDNKKLTVKDSATG